MTGFVPMFGREIINKKKTFKGKTDFREETEDKYKKRRLELIAKKKAEKEAKKN